MTCQWYIKVIYIYVSLNNHIVIIIKKKIASGTFTLPELAAGGGRGGGADLTSAKVIMTHCYLFIIAR